jgi:RimJ/RimL family protein N-acetyltransferase
MAEKKTYPTPPSLVGDKIYLRPATPDDIANTYHWFTLSEPQSMSSHPLPFRTAAEAMESYKKEERTTDRQTFMVVRKEDNLLVGRIRFFDLNDLNRTAEIGLLVDPDMRRKGYGAEAVKVLVKYLIRYRGLNKVHAQTAAFNSGAVALLESTGFRRDGTLRHHYFYKGEYHHGFVYSVLAHELEQ